MSDGLEPLFECLREYLHLEAADHVLFALAVAVSASLREGEPLWGMIVGPASSGKTEAIRVLDRVAHEHPDEITAPSLLSWSKAKEPKAVGILTRIPSPAAFLTVADFSTVLATSDRGGRDQLFALLRRAYDGAISRDLGNAARALTWHGRLTLLAGCTSAIDDYSSHSDALGPRWLYCRVAEQSGETKRATGRKALGAGHLDSHRAKAAELATAVVRDAVHRVPDVLAPDVSAALVEAAIVACYARAAVERSGYGSREILGVPVVEEPPRLAGQLALLARALLALGVDSDSAVALCHRCALDSIPQARRRALSVLASSHTGVTASDVGRRGALHRHVARRALEELEAIGIADGDDEPGERPHWMLTGDEEQLVRAVFAQHDEAERVARKVGINPPTPRQGEGENVLPHVSCQSDTHDDLDPVSQLLVVFPGAEVAER